MVRPDLNFSISRDVFAPSQPFVLHVYAKGSPGKVAVGQPIVMTEQNEAERIEPTAMVSREAAQQLMDELYMAGLRPSSEARRQDVVQSKDEHLSDLRKIAFKALKIED